MTTIFPALSTHYGLKKSKKICDILKTASRIMLFLLIPSCVGLAIIAPTALILFYGSNYVTGAMPMAILSICTIVTALFTLYTTTFGAIGKTRQVLKINFIASIITILTLLFLVPLLDTTGAALARLITNVGALAIAIWLLRKEVTIEIDKKVLWKSIISTILFIPFLIGIELFLSKNLSTIQTFVLEIGIAAVIYVVALSFLKALKHEDFELLTQAFPKPLAKYVKIIEKIIIK
jgi:stage V sporulation protein B